MRVQIDQEAGLAYISFSDNDVVRTIEVDEAINIDLDQYAVAVGIEVLDFDATIPFQDLITKFHVPFEQVELLRILRPNMKQFVARSLPPQETDAVQAAESVGVC